MSGPRWKLAPPLLVLIGLLLLPVSGAAADPSTTFTDSTLHYRYDVYLGSVELLRPGSFVPYKTVEAFESEIRFDQQAADHIASALAPDGRFAAGIATPAPDGGSWITAASRPAWWEKPNGSTEAQPLFDAEARFAAAPQLLLIAGETASCTEAETVMTVLEDDEASPSGELSQQRKPAELTFGPDVIWIGKDRSEKYVLADGETNFNTVTSFLTLTVHRLNRTCVVSPAPASVLPPPAPDRCKSAPDTDKDAIPDACDEDPSIPDSCTLRVARSRVFVYSSKPKVRLVVKYKTRTPAEVKTTYTAKLANGRKLMLGSLNQRFKASGTFKLPVSFDEGTAAKVRTARSFAVSFSIPGAPKACARAYAKALTKKQRVGKQTVWFQADAVLGGIF